jgi:alpha-D-ribose 1-methylphosphonate 5-triphosphate synthase subunit PhnG
MHEQTLGEAAEADRRRAHWALSQANGYSHAAGVDRAVRQLCAIAACLVHTTTGSRALSAKAAVRFERARP